MAHRKDVVKVMTNVHPMGIQRERGIPVVGSGRTHGGGDQRFHQIWKNWGIPEGGVGHRNIIQLDLGSN